MPRETPQGLLPRPLRRWPPCRPAALAALALAAVLLAPALARAQFAPPGIKKAPGPGSAPSMKKVPGEGLRFTRDPSAAAAISADELLEDRERQRIVGRGFADVRFMGNRLQADHIEVQTETRDGVATGNIVFQTANDRFVGTRAEFNLDSQRVIIFNARGFIGATYYVRGEIVRRLSLDRYEVIRGSFTTCAGDVPDWSFGFKRATFQVEGYAQLQTPVARVAGLPVAALPWAIFPIKNKRASGFLLPGIGNGGRNGLQFSPTFFWAINDWSDATFGFDYLSKRGIRYVGEYRYVLSQNSEGSIQARTIRDKLDRTTFWDIKTHHSSVFPGINASFTADIDEAKRVKTDRSLETNLIERTRQETDTRVTFVRDFSEIAGQFQFGMRRREGLNESNGQLFQRLPEAIFNIRQKQLGTSDFYFNLDSSYVNFRRVLDDNTINVQRVHLEPSLSLPLKTVPWLGVTPEIGIRETYWTRQKRDSSVGSNPASTDQVDSGLSREMWFADLNIVGPRFSRVYDATIGPFNDFKHIVSFDTTYSYSPAMDPKDRRLILALDSIDNFQDHNFVAYGMTNRVLTKLQRGEGFETRQLFTFSVSQTYDIAESRRTINLPTTPRRPFSDVTFRFESRPISQVRLLQTTLFNPYEGEIREHTTGIRLDGGRNWYLNIDRIWKRQRNRFPVSTGESFINVSGGLAVTPQWFIEYLTRLNKTENATLEQSIILRYNGCCWGFALTLTDTRDRSEIFLSFSLLGLIEGESVPTFKSRRSIKRGEGRFFGSGGLAPLPFQPPETGATP